jgi:multiple sugar transport system substrate-binding protein
MKRHLAALAGAALLTLALAACTGGGGSSGDASGQVNYWLWDANQLPAYQACATAFQQENPKITVKIQQLGWDDYWSKLTTGFVSGTAPDVFTDHLAKYPEFASKHQLLPLDDLIKKDGVKTDVYQPGLADLWVAPDGARYGLPKDWDTVAIFYNKKMATDAGVTAAQLNSLTWNPTDGGTYEKVIAHLTVDNNGKRGDEPGFDKTNVKVYGLGLENSGNGVGQTQWSMYTGTTGFQFTDKNPWGTKYFYDDPRFVDTITWWRSLISKGYMPPLKVAASGVSVSDAFAAGKSAMNTNGSWMVGQYFGYKGVDVGLAPTPVGPNGKRASTFNGLADSIWAGTKHKEAAWQWVKFLASPACQNLVGEQAVVFPAIPGASDIAAKKFQAKGVDTSAFTVQVKDKTTLLYPITDHAAEIEAIMQPAMDSIMSFKADPQEALSEATQKVNALFQQ